MKASIKFREEQKPLFRAKVPLNFLGFPFQSGIVAGESKDLSFNLTTFFESGPSFKVAYRPNDSLNPFSVVFKTETGHFGLPVFSSFKVTADFNLNGGVKKPRFFVHLKPHLGNFIIKKLQPLSKSPLESPAADVVNGALSDVEMTTTTAIRLRKNAMLSFRWGVRIPATGDSSTVQMKMNDSMGGISIQKLPSLIINKIGIDCNLATIDAAEAFLGVNKQMEIIQAENGDLKKAMDNLQGEICNGLKIAQAENESLEKLVDQMKDEFFSFIIKIKSKRKW